jgi:hypothetical protein
MRDFLLVALLASPALWAGDDVKPPVANSSVVEVRGTIAKVQTARGQGMPYLEVNTANGTVKLYLGSMRYLMQENFLPKAGEALEAKGYKASDGVVAIRVELPASKKVLKLRDENGWPLWRGGRWRGGRSIPEPR